MSGKSLALRMAALPQSSALTMSPRKNNSSNQLRQPMDADVETLSLTTFLA